MSSLMTCRHSVRAAVFAIVAVLIVSSGALAAWNSPTELRAASFKAAQPDLAAHGPNLISAWTEPTGTAQVWVEESIDAGDNFLAPVRLDNHPSHAARDISVFSRTTAHIAVWSEAVAGGGSRIFMSEAAFGTSAWSGASMVSTNTGVTWARNPRIAASGNFLVLVYQAQTAPSSPYWGFVRVYDRGASTWGNADLLPNKAPLSRGDVRVAVSNTRVLVVWTDAAGSLRERRGKIYAAGTSFLWFAGHPTLGIGHTPRILLSGSDAVVLWARNADIFRRLSSNAGSSWGPQLKILDGHPGTDTSAGNAYRLYGAAMSGVEVVFTVGTGPGTPELGQGYRMRSHNSGSAWNKIASFPWAGDMRQVTYTQALTNGPAKIGEAWIRASGNVYPWALEYHREQ